MTPDSQYVVYTTENGVYSALLSGGPARKLSSAADYQLSSDARFVVVEANDEQLGHKVLSSIPIDGGAPIKLAEGLGAGGEPGPQSSDASTAMPAWEPDYRLTPDGRSVVYRTKEALFSVPITGGGPVKLSAALEPDTYIYGYTITPDSRLVIYDTRRSIPWGCPHTPSAGANWVKVTSISSVPVSGGTPSAVGQRAER